MDDDYETWALWQAPEVLERIQDGGAKQNQRCQTGTGNGANLKHFFCSAKVEILMRCKYIAQMLHGIGIFTLPKFNSEFAPEK